jgi:hypothetical protein
MAQHQNTVRVIEDARRKLEKEGENHKAPEIEV